MGLCGDVGDWIFFVESVLLDITIIIFTKASFVSENYPSPVNEKKVAMVLIADIDKSL